MKKHTIYKECSRCLGKGVITLGQEIINNMQAQGVEILSSDIEVGCAKCNGRCKIDTEMWVEL